MKQETKNKFYEVYNKYRSLHDIIVYQIRFDNYNDYSAFDKKRDYSKSMQIIKKFIKNCENKENELLKSK